MGIRVLATISHDKSSYMCSARLLLREVLIIFHKYAESKKTNNFHTSNNIVGAILLVEPMTAEDVGSGLEKVVVVSPLEKPATCMEVGALDSVEAAAELPLSSVVGEVPVFMSEVI